MFARGVAVWLISTTAAAVTPPSEVTALNKLFEALGGHAWPQRAGWNTTSDPCNFTSPSASTCAATCYGHTCDYWSDGCSYMESYGCDCSGCGCGVARDGGWDGVDCVNITANETRVVGLELAFNNLTSTIPSFELPFLRTLCVAIARAISLADALRAPRQEALQQPHHGHHLGRVGLVEQPGEPVRRYRACVFSR